MLAWFKSWLARKSPNHKRQLVFSFDGKCITADGPLAEKTLVRVENIQEIGIETTDLGPYVEDVFLLINRDTDALRIPQGSAVFNELMAYCDTLEGFDWQPFTAAMSCTDSKYFLCWKKPLHPTNKS